MCNVQKNCTNSSGLRMIFQNRIRRMTNVKKTNVKRQTLSVLGFDKIDANDHHIEKPGRESEGCTNDATMGGTDATISATDATMSVKDATMTATMSAKGRDHERQRRDHERQGRDDERHGHEQERQSARP